MEETFEQYAIAKYNLETCKDYYLEEYLKEFLIIENKLCKEINKII